MKELRFQNLMKLGVAEVQLIFGNLMQRKAELENDTRFASVEKYPQMFDMLIIVNDCIEVANTVIGIKINELLLINEHVELLKN